MMLFYDWINNTHNIGASLLKYLPDRWASHQNKTKSLNFRIFASLTVILSVFVIRGLIRWIAKYKLQYLFRISCIIFIYNTFALIFSIFGFPLNLHITSLCFPNWQESPILSLDQKIIWISSTAMCCFMAVLRYHWALPFNIIMESSMVGFSHLNRMAKIKRQTARKLSENMINHKKLSDVNPVYVNGWIPLIESTQVVRRKAVTVLAVGYKFCVFRGDNDQVHILDAYCPHIGADMSAGGKVVGNCIECPFHGWQFSGETGKCTKIPYSNNIPDIANVKVWDSREKNGYIFVWHHAENEPPSWELPSVPEIESGEWAYRGRSEFTVHCHIQEIPENGADIAHLSQVHSRLVFFGPDMENTGRRDNDWITHDWKPQWLVDENESHIIRINLLQRFMILGYEIPFSRFDVDIQQIGPASVYLSMKSAFGKCILLQYITTEEPMLQRIVHLLYSEPRFKPGPSLFVIWGEGVMIQRDIAIWNNKTFLRKPLLVKEDKLISKFRRWFSQFYSEHSPTLKDLRQRTLDW